VKKQEGGKKKNWKSRTRKNRERRKLRGFGPPVASGEGFVAAEIRKDTREK